LHDLYSGGAASEMRFVFTPPGADIERVRVWSDVRLTTPVVVKVVR
jgi:hypothetical protein